MTFQWNDVKYHTDKCWQGSFDLNNNLLLILILGLYFSWRPVCCFRTFGRTYVRTYVHTRILHIRRLHSGYRAGMLSVTMFLELKTLIEIIFYYKEHNYAWPACLAKNPSVYLWIYAYSNVPLHYNPVTVIYTCGHAYACSAIVWLQSTSIKKATTFLFIWTI